MLSFNKHAIPAYTSKPAVNRQIVNRGQGDLCPEVG